jgi:hypothetical protein
MAAVLCGCHNSEELVFSDSEKVSAIRSRNERFQNLLLGSPANPYSGEPALTLRVPGWSECQIGRSLEGELLRRCNASDHVDASGKSCIGPHPGRGPRAGHIGWGKDAVWVSLLNDSSNNRYIDLVIRGKEVLGVSIYCNPIKGTSPIEVQVADSSWQSFPLDKDALITLFGQAKASHQWMAE